MTKFHYLQHLVAQPVSAQLKKNILAKDSQEEMSGVISVFFLIIRTFFNSKTQLKVNFYFFKRDFFSPFLTIFHGKKL
jgi:hypothetical protein